MEFGAVRIGDGLEPRGAVLMEDRGKVSPCLVTHSMIEEHIGVGAAWGEIIIRNFNQAHRCHRTERLTPLNVVEPFLIPFIFR